MSAVRDIAQDLFDRFAGFVRGHASGDRGHPGVGVAFIIAALLVLLLGLRWFTDSGGASGSAEQDWALDITSDGPATTIGASPEAVAVRVGAAVPRGVGDQTVTIGIPGTSVEIEIPLGPTTTTGGPGPTTGGSSGGGGGTTPTTRPSITPTTRPGGGGTTTPPTTAPPTTAPPTTAPPTTAPPTTEPPTTDPPTTTEPPPPEGLDLSAAGGLVGTLLGELGALLS
jgi:hypothetical protein